MCVLTSDTGLEPGLPVDQIESRLFEAAKFIWKSATSRIGYTSSTSGGFTSSEASRPLATTRLRP